MFGMITKMFDVAMSFFSGIAVEFDTCKCQCRLDASVCNNNQR